MPFEQFSGAPRKIAVIGGGISGMGAAQMLADTHNVTLFEAEPRLGGHARTVMAGKRGDQPVDTGFIVFNKKNYPLLTGLFDRLDVPISPSDMSFGVSIDGGRIEYALTSADALFAQRANLVNPAFLGLVRDLIRFNSRAAETVFGRDMTVGELLDEMGLGRWFRDYYLLPFSGAIWSSPAEKMLDFPAASMISFFENHALLNYSGQHQWFTVQGGSVEYVRRLEHAMQGKGVRVRLGAQVKAVRRGAVGAQVRVAGADWATFDEVVFATHSDVTLGLLSDPTPREKALLGAVRYQPNEVILHNDLSVMPRRRKVWSSWVYAEETGRRRDGISMTYWMNSLQPIPKDDPLFVTLNASDRIDPAKIFDQVTMWHPVHDAGAHAARRKLAQFNGTGATWFCGAWMGNGFHEDGLASAVSVVEGINRAGAMQAAAE